MPDRSHVRELASQYIERGDPTGWFEALYREAERGESEIPRTTSECFGPSPSACDDHTPDLMRGVPKRPPNRI